MGVVGPAFATEALGLAAKDFVVIVLPLGIGVVTGILLLNNYGKYIPRRRPIETGLILLGIFLAILSAAGPVSRFLQHVTSAAPVDVSSLVSLLAVVIVLAFLAGIAYASVAIPSQTQLQEDLPQEVRGRVFGVLNMLISTASFLPIIIVGPIADWVSTTAVVLVVGARDHRLRGALGRPPAGQPSQPASRVSRTFRASRVSPLHEPGRRRVHRRDDQHGRRPAGRRGGPGPRRRGDPGPDARPRHDRRAACRSIAG